MGEAALKPVKISVCCLISNSSQPALHVSGWNRATGFAQQTVSSAHPPNLCSSAARLHRSQTLSSALLVRGGQKTLSTAAGAATWLPAWGEATWALKSAKLLL